MAAFLPPALPNYTVEDAMVVCGVDNADLFNGETAAERFAEDIFDGNFLACMDKSFKELEEDFKTYAEQTRNQGQVKILPGVKHNIKAFIQWVRDEIRLGRDPSLLPFPLLDTAALIRRYKTHQQFIDKSKVISEAAKPEKFKSEMRWADWAPTFLNFLRHIPGRDGIPLKYICRFQDTPDPTPNANFLDDYVNMAPLSGEAFTIDAAEVHTFLINFTAGNETAEAKMKQNELLNNGRLDFLALRDHYEGVGILALDITKAETTIANLFYIGEKKPTMWWEEFEKRLTSAFLSCDRHEGREVYSNAMKLRILLKKIEVDFLSYVKAGINIELAKPIVTMTYEHALAAFRNEVNRKFPPQFTTTTKTRRHINEVSGNRSHRGGRYGGRHGGRSRTGRGGRHENKRKRNDSTFITLTDGKRIEYHPSFSFPTEIYNKFKPQDMEQLRNDRNKYNETKNQRKQIQELQRQLSSQNSQGVQTPIVPTDVSIGQTTRISQISTSGGTMMGGRNDQANQRRNT